MLDEVVLNVQSNAVIRSEFDSSLSNDLSRSPIKREKMWVDMLLKGCVPSWCRTLVPVTVAFNDAGAARHLTLYVGLDYLSLGADEDSFIVPLSGPGAQSVCDAWDCIFPTTKIVDLVWRAAPFKLEPKPWGPPYDHSMQSTSRILAHDSIVEKQIEKLGDSAKLRKNILAGHKKDVVLSNKLIVKPKNVCIYGWHQKNGKPIQPVSTAHEASYSDYAHGVRLVSKKCFLDDQEVLVADLMKDKKLCKLVSSEGSIGIDRYRI